MIIINVSLLFKQVLFFNNLSLIGLFKSNQQTDQSIVEKIRKSDCTIEELLEEEDILQEVKNSKNNNLYYLN